jgi:hypothetical protein
MGLQPPSIRPCAFQAHANDPRGTGLKPALPGCRLLGQQRHKTALLIIELEGAVGGVDTPTRISVHIKPCPPTATHPAAQQTIGEGLVSERGVTH